LVSGTTGIYAISKSQRTLLLTYKAAHENGQRGLGLRNDECLEIDMKVSGKSEY